MTDAAIKSLRNSILSTGISKVVIGDLPALQLDCVAIRPVDGYASTYYFGATSLGEPLIEVIVRNKSYEVGQAWYNGIVQKLDQSMDESVGILSCMLTGSPGYLGRDIEGFSEWHILFHVTLKE